MSRQDRLAEDLDRGFEALEDGRIDDAMACVERCQRIDRGQPDVIMLAAAVADARGDTEDALAMYRKLIELQPDEPLPYICIARLELHDLGDPDAALETVESAFDYIDEEPDLIAAVTVRSEALLAVEDLEGARASLAELSTSVIDDGSLALDLAELALAAEDPSLAASWVEAARKTPELEADALHMLGRIHELTGDRAQMIAAWQEVRKLDAAAPDGAVTISEDALEKLAHEALAELPAEVRARLANVPILIDELPSEAMVGDGLDPRLLGLFQGTPMPGGGELAPTVTNILLFKTNLERSATGLDHLAEEVRITVLHETAHYFGLDEDDLERIGLD
jgi:predicted Zn-dependent protease with MMP-like domain/Tfp pilus assembly protein PilF